MSLNDASPAELREKFQGKEVTVVTSLAEVPAGSLMKTALEFFDLVCEKNDRKRGECQSVPLEADAVLEGVLDEED
jgi:hypothetical protein